MPMTKVESEHDQLISMLRQLVDEREILSRENEYLKARLNESMLMETIKELKKERDLLLKLLSNLRNNQKSTQLPPPSPSHKQNSSNRMKINPTIAYSKYLQTNKKLKHSQNSPFQRYHSQSLQDLT